MAGKAAVMAMQASLRGRGHGNCHPGELGAALRRLGLSDCGTGAQCGHQHSVKINYRVPGR